MRDAEVLIKFKGDTTDLDNKTKGLSAKLKGVSSSLESAAKKVAPYSAVATGVIAGIAKVGAEFEKSMKNVQAISGASADDMKRLEEKAREMGKSTVFSASQSADALSYMALAGWKTEDMLNGLPGVLNLAAAGDVDLARASDIVTDALTAFGKQAKDSEELVDVMAATMSNSNTTVDLLGESFKYVASVAGSMKYSMQDTSFALGLMANAGIKGSQAGTSLRSVMTRLASDTGGARTALEELGVKVTNADGSFRPLEEVIRDTQKAFSGLTDEQKTQIATTVAGKNGLSGFLAMANATEADTNKLSEAISKASGTAQDMADTMNESTANQLKILMSEVQELALQFADFLIPAIKTVVQGFTSFVQGLQKISPEAKKVIGVVLIIVATLAPVLLIISKIITAIATIIPVIKAVMGVVAAFNAILMANPLILIIAGIALIVAGLIALWMKCEEFRNFVMGLISAVVAIITTGIEIVKSIFNVIWTFIKAVVTGIAEDIKAKIELVKTIVSTVFEVIKTIITTVINTVKSIVLGVINGIINAFQKIGNVVRSVFTGVRNTIRNIFNTVIGIIKAPINGVIGLVNGVIRGLNKLKVPDWVPGLGGKGVNIPLIPKLATGTNFVPKDTLAYIHQGEAVVPKKFNPYANGISNNTLGAMQVNKSSNIEIKVYNDMEIDPIGQVVSKIKTYAGGSKNDFNYGQGV